MAKTPEEALKDELNKMAVRVSELKQEGVAMQRENDRLEKLMNDEKVKREETVKLTKEAEEAKVKAVQEAEVVSKQFETVRNDFLQVQKERDMLLEEVQILKDERRTLGEENAELSLKRDTVTKEFQEREERIAMNERTLKDIKEELDLQQAILEKRERILALQEKAR